MARKLSAEQTLHLVSLYRSHECLWNVFSDNHKNSFLRKQALRQICADLDIEGFTVDDVKYKIKTIRSTYYLELDKIRKSQSSDNVYKPKALWFEEIDSFLKHVLTKRKVQDTDDEHVEINNSIPESVEPDQEVNDENPLVSERPDPSSDYYEIKFNQQKKRKIPKREGKVQDLRDGIRDVPKERIRGDGDDEYDVFGRHVACQLRQLSTLQYLLAQEEIQSTITKCRMNDLE